MALHREVDVGVRIGLPSLALEHPARLAATAGVAAANDVRERAVRVLRVLFEVAETVETLLVAQLDAAQVEHAVLHRHRHLLALAGGVAVTQGGKNADRQMHAALLSPKAAALTVGGPSHQPVVEAAPPAHCATFS